MIAIEPINPPDPINLWELLDKHNMISGALAAKPGMVVNLCNMANFLVWHIDGEPLALQIEVQMPDPEVMEIMLVPEDRWLGKRRDDVTALQQELRDRWFHALGVRRVQANVPASRVNLHRVFKCLGFVEETRHDIGMRGGIRLGQKVEPVVSYGLIETDPVKVWRELAHA